MLPNPLSVVLIVAFVGLQSADRGSCKAIRLNSGLKQQPAHFALVLVLQSRISCLPNF